MAKIIEFKSQKLEVQVNENKKVNDKNFDEFWEGLIREVGEKVVIKRVLDFLNEKDEEDMTEEELQNINNEQG